MSNGSQLSNSPIWNWRSWMNGLPNPYDIFMGPQNLQQPILPGWVLGNVFNVTTQNSSASETEAEIVAAHSYGRQIGRIMDALALVIEELPKKKQAAKAIEKFNEIHGKIDEIKAGAMARRLETLA